MLFLEIFVAVKTIRHCTAGATCFRKPFYGSRPRQAKRKTGTVANLTVLPYATLRRRSSMKKYSVTSSASHSPRRASSRIVCAACS